jgi:prepilin-type processing-associated H-X9-DG protein
VQLYRSSWLTVREQTWLTTLAQTSGVAKSDYAANSGDALEHSGDTLTGTTLSPTSYGEAATWGKWQATNKCVPSSGGRGGSPQYRYCQTGVMYFRSELNRSRITDGATNTYLVGEKYLDPFRYEYDPSNPATITFGDNQSAWTGYEWDNHRVAWNATLPVSNQETFQPKRDTPGEDNYFRFGSAHSGGLNMSFCDGSVQFVAYDIDPETHRRFASRMDGEVADPSGL